MTSSSYLYLAVDGFGLLVCIRSLLVLRAGSPWTLAGWACAGVYFAILFVRAATGWPVGAQPLIVVCAVAFAIGAIRDERQAEPWWWPRTLGRTRAERRARELE